jgi:hypothetical protein
VQFGCNQRYHAQTPVGTYPVNELVFQHTPETLKVLTAAGIKEIQIVYTNANTLNLIQQIGESPLEVLCTPHSLDVQPNTGGIKRSANTAVCDTARETKSRRSSVRNSARHST